jgi:hypothetical protein
MLSLQKKKCIIRVKLQRRAVSYNTSFVVYLNFSRDVNSLLKSFIVTQSLKKFSPSSNQLFLKDPETEPYPDLVYSVPHHEMFIDGSFKHYPTIYIVFQVVSPPADFQTKILHAILWRSYVCYVLCISYSPWFRFINNNWRRKQFLKTLVV